MPASMSKNLDPYTLHLPHVAPLPIVISCPHVGTEIPVDISSGMTSEALQTEDTDWFVHELYSFAPSLGIHLLQARFSRYVIDLNRDPAGARLYADKRIETSLVPTSTFKQQAIYDQTPPDQNEVNRRLNLYFQPYHQILSNLLHDLRKKYPHVLLIDAHSIRRHVPSIRPEPFADIILGDQAGKTAHPVLSATALAALSQFNTKHNDPFMGGYITRFFGKPDLGIHALQIEMSQDIYMNEATSQRDVTKEKAVQAHLKNLLQQLAQKLEIIL